MSIKKDRCQLSTQLAELIADYREGEIAVPDAEHVQKWLQQFEEDEKTQNDILRETLLILQKTYASKERVRKFLSGLIVQDDFVGKNPASFWKASNVLNIQQRGHSQLELRQLFGELLKERFGLSVDDCNSSTGPFIYLDDAVFTGTHVLTDIKEWLPNAPAQGALNIVTIAIYTGAEYRIQKELPVLLNETHKKMRYYVWRLNTLQNYSNAGSEADVLRLRNFPSDDASKKFLEAFGGGKPPAYLRQDNIPNRSALFSNEEARNLLENAFWKAGLRIREMCPNLKVMHRPLGYTTTNSANKLGFGSMFVSYRNCPNNAPLALWAGHPWYPLFERKTN